VYNTKRIAAVDIWHGDSVPGAKLWTDKNMNDYTLFCVSYNYRYVVCFKRWESETNDCIEAYSCYPENGATNAERVFLSWNRNDPHYVTIKAIDSSNFNHNNYTFNKNGHLYLISGVKLL
jgi:hypothetical protein